MGKQCMSERKNTRRSEKNNKHTIRIGEEKYENGQFNTAKERTFEYAVTQSSP